MELRVLQYFLMVAREENITRAAELLHITQPTLSRQLMQLEEELGVTLFHRGKRRITLTADGMLLRRRAEELVSLAEKTVTELSRSDNVLSGTVAIGSGEYKSTSFLATLIQDFQQAHPQVQFQIYSGTADNIQERIAHGLLDLWLLQEPVDISRYSFVRLPVQEEWGAYIPIDHPLAEKSVVTPQELAAQPLFWPERASIRHELENWFGSYANDLTIIGSGNLIYNQAVIAAKSGAIVVAIALDCHYDGLRFVPFSPPLRSPTVLAWKKAQVFSDASEAFIAHIKQYTSSMMNDQT